MIIDIPLKHDRMKEWKTTRAGQRGKQMKKKGIGIILMAVFAVILISGCKRDVGTPEDNAVVEETEEETEDQTKDWMLGYSCPDLSDPFYQVLKDSVGMALENQGNPMMVRDAQQDADVQASQIKEMINADVDLVFLCPVDPEQITASLEALKEAGIPVINLSVRVEETGLTDAFIGSDDENAGKVCAQDLTEKRPAGGKLVLVESPADAAVNVRITGFEEAISNKGFEVVRRIDAEKTETGIQAEIKSVLSEEELIDAIMCGDDQMALQVLQALDDVGRNDILVYCVGGSPEVKTVLAASESPMAGIGAQSPINMGKTAAKTAAALLDGGAYENEISVETFFISRENLDMYGTDGWQ